MTILAGEQVGTKCSIQSTHITGLWLYESQSWCLEHWAPISLKQNIFQYSHQAELIGFCLVILAIKKKTYFCTRIK